MKSKIYQLIFLCRAYLMRHLKPKNNYWLAKKSVQPISRKFGFDRGTPIDRHWIETFLKKNQKYIHGVCLEVGDNRYTRQFGKNVQKSDVLDVDKKNKKANIYADLRNIKSVQSNTYDCVVLTHVLGMIDDYDSALSECKRILKPGGTLLATMCSFGPVFSGLESNFWRFTVPSAKFVFGKHFKSVTVESYGNALAGQSFWVGLSQEELTKEQLDFNDPYFPCVVGILAVK